MGRHAVIKGASYILAAAPDMVLHNGTTQTMERRLSPKSPYLTEIRRHLRTFDQVVSYPPNQVFIGNRTPEELAGLPEPWHGTRWEDGRWGAFGEIMPQDEFYGLMTLCDTFDLVMLETDFAGTVMEKLSAHPLLGKERAKALEKHLLEEARLRELMEEEGAEGLFHEGRLAGVVKRAHDVDETLSAHVMTENLANKASSVLALLHLVKLTGIDPGEVEYVIDCSEEACGDMNQRGGGNFAKAAAEAAGLTGASGSDTRAFCAAPAHAILEAASLVKAGTFRTVAVTAGGCIAKLGMNGRDHLKKGLPILEDVAGGFALLIGENDGINPEIRCDISGRHRVGTGSSPQAVISALVTEPLANAGLSLTDVDTFSVEMQNPEITKPAGAGDVPLSNYKMIAALGVKLGELEKSQISEFVEERGMPGWAPTQGHIPSGVPYLGFARKDMLAGKINRAMIIGKGSLFLGRMTNLFDGVSFLLSANPGGAKEQDLSRLACGEASAPSIGIAAAESELGMESVWEAAELAAQRGLCVEILTGGDVHQKMVERLNLGELKACVTMHYPFPIGVSTVGRIPAPARGNQMFLASTTGTSSVERTCALVKNALYGSIVARACGVKNPRLGLLNLEGARAAAAALQRLREGGYPMELADSIRGDGGFLMRGNDLLCGTADVMVADTLTGNLLMKLLSSWSGGGRMETCGYGYGPGIGEGMEHLICIVSRASGPAVIAGAAEYAADLLRGGWREIFQEEWAAARKAGLDDILRGFSGEPREEPLETKGLESAMPEKEPVTAQIQGIEVTDLEEAAETLWKAGIYAETGMGCTGPVILCGQGRAKQAEAVLKEAGYLT